MKLLYCYPYGILGGVCTQLWSRARYLSERHEIHCLFQKDYGVAEYLGAYATTHFGLSEERAHTLVRDERFDAVIVIDAPTYLEWFANPVATRDYRVVLEVHTTYEQSLRYLERSGIHVDVAAVPSSYMREMLGARDYPVLRGKHIEVVPNSVDPAHFAPVEATPTDEPVILWVGKMDEHKNWRAAMRITAATPPPRQLWFAGGETCPNDVAGQVIDYAHECGIAANFRWIDRVEHAAMPRLYSTVARGGGCNLVTSNDESFGMSVVEALLSGLPVVSTDVGAIPDIVGKGGTAYAQLYARGREQDAVDHVAGMLGSDAHQRLLADRPGLAERFAPEQVNPRYEQFFTQVIQGTLPSEAQIR